MMLRDDLYGKEVLEYCDIRVLFYCFYQTLLNLGARIIFVMKDTEFRVSAFFM